jgi:hypothetical protein
LVAGPALGQSWIGGGNNLPNTRGLIAVDATGEPAWLFGPEDIAGDGAGSFTAAEREIDLRSAYAAVELGRLWLRVYTSGTLAPLNLRVLVFIDVDNDSSTGGSRRAQVINPALADEPDQGGYELVLELADGEELASAWRWTEMPDRFEALSDLAPLDAVAEFGVDEDPLLLGFDRHTYRQVNVELSGLELDADCDAQLSFWASDGAMLIDRELGEVAPCVSADANDNGLADVAESDASCTLDSQCPAGGVCRESRCVPPTAAPGTAGAGGESGAVQLAAGEVVQGGALSCSLRSALARVRNRDVLALLALSFGMAVRRARWSRRRRPS